MGVWVLAGSWSSQQLTDGFVPDWFVSGLPQGRAHAQRLVEAGLWHPAVGGYCFHDWEQANPSRDDVLRARELAAERAARYRDRRAQSKNGGSHA